MAEPNLSFAGLLRQLRAEARLTQEELAEAASLSPRSVSDLERGVNRTARKDTALLLADALSLAGPVRVLFVAAARGKAPATEVLAARRGAAPGAFAAAATRALPRDIAAFTGRQSELTQMMRALAAEAAAHQLATSFPDGQFFLPLHAHTAGQRPVGPADALASLLMTAGIPAAHIPPGLEARAARWRDVTGDYRAATASLKEALKSLYEVGEPAAQGYARNDLGLVQQLTGDYQAAADSHHQALTLLRDAGEPYGQAYVLNSLGELACRRG